MINFEELTAWLLQQKRQTLHHSELARRRNDHRRSAELQVKATAYTEVMDYIGKYAVGPTEAGVARSDTELMEGHPIQDKYTLPETVVDIKK